MESRGGFSLGRIGEGGNRGFEQKVTKETEKFGAAELSLRSLRFLMFKNLAGFDV